MRDPITSNVDHAIPAASVREARRLPVPHYLQSHYWWAYVHPRAVRFFERQWLVNLILWGNYRKLCEAVLHGFRHHLPGRTLQIACAYGDLTPRLAACVPEGGQLDVVDILPIQLQNLAGKLADDAPVKMHCMDSTSLDFANAQFDRALLFFLLHEQPLAARRQTLGEALRVVRPGGTLTIVDYGRPSRWNLLHYLWAPLIGRLEPFASDLWREDVCTWLPAHASISGIRRQRFFGGLYQMMTITVGE